MILLDELDVKEKDYHFRRESLPPYSPRRSFRLPVVTVPWAPANLSSVPSIPSTPSSTSTTLHPRSASLASANYAQSQSTLTLNSNISSQTLWMPPLPTPPASASVSGSCSSQLPPSLFSLLLSLPAPRSYPPSHLRASNHVYVERGSAPITGSFLIDPALQVPECLLPDDPDVLLVREKGAVNGKGKQKRANLCLVTRGGDVAVDIWIREGCALQGRKAMRRQGGGSSISGYTINDRSNNGGSRSTRNSLDSYDNTHYWDSDWAAPPSHMPWPEKTKERVDIDIRSETGSIAVRIHAPSHLRLQIHVSSSQGSVAVGVPRTFAGYVESDAHVSRSDSASSTFSLDSLASLQRLRLASASTFSIPSLLGEKGKDKDRPSIADDLVGIMQEVSQTLPASMRQPVQFSSEMESRVLSLRRTEKGRYLIGFDLERALSEQTDARYFDELRYSGTVTVFYNDEYSQNKPDNIITKLLNKAR